MRRLLGQSALAIVAASTVPASAQTPPTPTADQSPLGITVTAKKLDEARGSIQPSLGASRYDFTPSSLESVPNGDKAPISQVLLRAPGVAQDSFGQVHVRGEHANLQYRLDGVQLPEGMSLFTNVLATQYASKISLIDGALPAQYGFRTSGVMDIALKSGRSDPGAEASMTIGSYNWRQPSFAWGASSGRIDAYLSGQFLHNAIGIENPEASSWPIHDQTDQWHGLAKISGIVDDNTRISLILGGSSAQFQIPQLAFAGTNNQVAGVPVAIAALLDQRQWEAAWFSMLSLQKHHEAFDWQLSAFTRYSSLSYQPDNVGDLMFNGISPWTSRYSFASGMQGDGSWKMTPTHTLRSGFLFQHEHAISRTNAMVLPVDTNGATTSDQPLGIAYGNDQIGWTYGVYLQDEWSVMPTVTLNYGLRFDAISANTNDYQFGPRVNAVWRPNDVLTAHAGYARYFTPPPLAQVNNFSVNATLGTTAAPAVTQNGVAKPERADYFDAGFEIRPHANLKFGFDAYYKLAQDLLDEGQFGAPIFLASFNYANAQIKGIELTGSYDKGPWSLYGNFAWSEAKGTKIISAQFNFQPDDLTFINNNYIYLDHNQSATASAGVSYTFNQDTDWATRVSADFIYGQGLRQSVLTPNDNPLPSYEVLNLSAKQKIPIGAGRETTVRFDVLNVTDNAYQIRSGTGVGVGAPQFGQRRTFLVTLTEKF